MTDPQAAEDLDRTPQQLRCLAVTTATRSLMTTAAALSTGGLLGLLAVLVGRSNVATTPLDLIRLALVFVVAPAAVFAILRASAAATVGVVEGNLVLRRRGVRTEIPLTALASVRSWRLPLPASGFDLALASGRRFECGLVVEAPSALVERMQRSGVSVEAPKHWTIVHGDARAAWRTRRWYDPVLRFPLFALVPTLPLFRVHQLIAYGGLFGEYQQYGLGAYLLGFFVYWATLTVYLMVYRAVLRIPAEIVTSVVAVLRPSAAPLARRLVERCVALLYYGGVPTLLLLRFVPW